MVDPVSVDDYRAHGGYRGLEAALKLDAEGIVAAVRDSGLRGRGGAGFPAGIKWNTVMLAKADQKYVVCNADEGDSGTFADRMMMEGDPFNLIEGMTIAGVATGATRGYIYLRSEYPQAFATLKEAIANGVTAGVLGDNVLGSGKSFHLEVRLGAGAYICGEETSLLESLEGKRGIVRAKPPIPALKGFLGKPTLVNNVMTFTAVPWILENGARAYADYGMGRSLGTLPIQLAGNIKHGGLIEMAFGITLRRGDRGFRRRHPLGPAGPGRAGRRAARAPTSPTISSTRPSITRRWRPRRASSATAASWCSTTPSTWPPRPASPSSSAPPNRAASAPPAASARPVASRPWTR